VLSPSYDNFPTLDRPESDVQAEVEQGFDFSIPPILLEYPTE